MSIRIPRGATVKSGVGKPVEDTVCKIAELEQLIHEDIDKLVGLKMEIRKAISTVPDVCCQTLLELRYLSFLSWEEVAVKMNYSWRWTMRLHGRSLKAIESHIQDVI